MTRENTVETTPLPCEDHAEACPEVQITEGRSAELGAGFTVRRLLPTRGRRMIGPWCFLDHFGPVDVAGGGLRVGPHPHIGLQTVTWVLDGDILHRDSLGHEQPIRRGQLNLMTSGRGIAHSEETPAGARGTLHGVQLWVALPESARHIAPEFEHHAALPATRVGEAVVTVFLGHALGLAAPGRIHSPLAGVELHFAGAGKAEVPLNAGWEYGIIAIDEPADVAGARLAPGELGYLGTGREQIAVGAEAENRLILVGGAPFGESILMWWNFVARTAAEIAEARAAWQRGEGFGRVHGYAGPALDAPELTTALKTR